MIRTVLKRTFSGAPEGVIIRMRKIIDDNVTEHDFPFDAIVDAFRTGWKFLVFTEEEIEDILTLSYKKQKADIFATLMLLYPSLNYKNAIDIDHMYPKSKFTISHLREMGVEEDKIPKYIETVNNICNLQLIYHPDNSEKKDTDFDVWFDNHNKTPEERQMYQNLNYLPPDINYTFNNFEVFIEKRRDILKNILCKLLEVKKNYNTYNL